MKVLFVTNLPSPYRVDFFNQLSDFCELTVVYERHSAADRDKKWVKDANGQYKVEYLKNLKIGADKSIGFELIKFLKKHQFNRIVFCGYSSPTIMIGIIYCRLHHIKYFIESDGEFELKNKDFFLKRQIKRFLISRCDGILTTCETDKKSFISLGADESKITKYPFSSVMNAEILDRCIIDDEKASLRNELDLQGEKIVLSVGRFIPVKGFDVLIQAAQLTKPNIKIYIVGGTPSEEYLQLCKDNQRVSFLNFMNKAELRRVYCAADLFVLPTRGDVWGLVINEAMACGLPVVTTDKCGAGEEMIINGTNGYIIPTDNSKALADAINYCLGDSNRLRLLSENALLTARKYSIETMVNRHVDVLIKNVEM